ncbi:MAG TPA: 2-amino-4-hydroxy-6-hydroxymethyldihydropteridine diphosphokinase [Ohtaekwangia sp.]
MNRHIFLSLGSNLGDRAQNLIHASRLIRESLGEIILNSSVYQTAAWGNEDQPAFLNQVLEITTSLTPEQALKCVLQIERSMGRERNEKWGERNIDIDILFYENYIISSGQLTVPHPEIANRRFVLLPLAEIAPYFVHPVLHKTIEELLEICGDNLSVEKM